MTLGVIRETRKQPQNKPCRQRPDSSDEQYEDRHLHCSVAGMLRKTLYPWEVLDDFIALYELSFRYTHSQMSKR